MKKLIYLGSFCTLLAWADSLPLTLSNAASYQTNAAITPGAIVTLKGPNLTGTVLAAPDSTHPPKTLGGVTVTVNDIPCAIYYVSPTQVNAVIDPSVAPGNAFVVLQSSTRTAQTSTFIQAPSAPAIFTLTGTGSGDGAIVNAISANTGAFSVVTNGGPTFLALFVTSLDLSTMPIVWVGGISVPVTYFGFPGTYPGMQQINVQLPASLAGIGSVELVVEQSGRRSNAVEVMLLPQQNVFPDDQSNQVRSRELASVAWIPNTSLVLVADQNDDVIRVVDLGQRKVTHVIALLDGAQPTAIGVHGSGTLAVVAERGRGAIALLDLTAFNVIAEFPTGFGPSAVAVAGDQAIIANSDADTASFFSFRAVFGAPALQVTATIGTGRLPRAVAVDSTHAYLTNESGGTITVLDLTNHTVVNTLNLGINVRPAAIQVISDQGVAIVAEPSAGPNGKLIFVNLANGQFTSVSANPDNTGGASSIAAVGDRIYLANQTGGTITTTPVSILPDTQLNPADVKLTPVNFKVDSGPRSLSVDSKDNLLLSANQGDGMLVLTDLTSNSITARIDAVRANPNETSDDHSDRLTAPNLPSLSSASPSTANAGGGAVNLTLAISGTNLSAASAVLFIDPATVSSLAFGKGNVNRGNFGVTDPAIIVTNLQVNPLGTLLTAEIQIQPNTQPRTRVIRVLTPNGETSFTNAPTLAIQ